MKNSGKKVLIIRLTSLGDVIFTLPLAKTLKQNGYEVDFLTAEKGKFVVENNPLFCQTFVAPLAKWKKSGKIFENFKEFLLIIKILRAQKYDIAIDCQQMFKSLFLFGFCGAKRLLTFSDARELSFLGASEFIKPKAPFRDPNYHVVERNLDFAKYLGITPKSLGFELPPVSSEAKKAADKLLKPLEGAPFAVIAPATTWENKHWDKKNWISLIEKLSEKTKLVFTSTSEELPILKDLGARKHLNLGGKTTLPILQEILSRSKVVISPDSGTANLAWACGAPIVEIYTATSAKHFGVYGKNAISLQSTSCPPCFKKSCKTKTLECQKTPSVETVLKALEKFV